MQEKYTIRDELVRSSLEAIANSSPEGLFLAGGMANQLYICRIYPELLRPTHDADFGRVPPMNRSLLEELYRNCFGVIRKYNPRRGNDREGFFIQLKEDENPFFIHFERPSKKYWEKNRRIRERELDTANEVYIPDTTSKLKVVRPEEIISSKLRRIYFVASKGLLTQELQNLYDKIKKGQFDVEINFLEWLKHLIQLKNSLSGYFEVSDEHGREARLRYNAEKDLYDILLLKKLADAGEIDFNERYLRQILKEDEDILN
ncbi:MAG: hypothetical protein QXO57_00225 [Candidatus Aenigmatarchaeota archaeon]